MQKQEFSLDGQEFIELIKLLKFVNVAQSGGEAKQMVTDGMVKLNGEVESRKRKKIIIGDVVEALGEFTIVAVK